MIATNTVFDIFFNGLAISTKTLNGFNNKKITGHEKPGLHLRRPIGHSQHGRIGLNCLENTEDVISLLPCDMILGILSKT